MTVGSGNDWERCWPLGCLSVSWRSCSTCPFYWFLLAGRGPPAEPGEPHARGSIVGHVRQLISAGRRLPGLFVAQRKTACPLEIRTAAGRGRDSSAVDFLLGARGTGARDRPCRCPELPVLPGRLEHVPLLFRGDPAAAFLFRRLADLARPGRFSLGHAD